MSYSLKHAADFDSEQQTIANRSIALADKIVELLDDEAVEVNDGVNALVFALGLALQAQFRPDEIDEALAGVIELLRWQVRGKRGS